MGTLSFNDSMLEESQINLEFLMKSRKKVRVGDIFVVKPKGLPYYFGRVIRDDANVGLFGPCYLLYFYNASSPDKRTIPKLDPYKLLIPPQATNKLGWVRGYFETVENRPLADKDVLPVHCFHDVMRNRYYDEYAHELGFPSPPVGVFGVGNHRTVDDDISDALGIPQAPD